MPPKAIVPLPFPLGRLVSSGLICSAVLLVFAGRARAFNPLAGDYSKDNPLDVRIMAYNTQGKFLVTSSTDAAFNRILTAMRPDLISFEEIADTVTTTAMATRLNTVIPIGGAGWQIHFGLLGGTRNAIASRYPLTLKRTDTIPVSSTRGVTIALADLPNASYPVDVYLLGVHLKCCGSAGGSEDVMRQRSADAIANWLGDARGVTRPSGDNIVLPANTPIIVLGDFNLVGGPQPENTLLTGNIQSEATFGPDVKGDWDVTDILNLNPLDPFTGSNITWQSSGGFPSSNLDRMMVTDSAFTVANKFVLNTNTMSAAARTAAGLLAGDTLASNSSDHLPIMVDLRVANPCAADADGDGTPDCSDGCVNDPLKIAPGVCGCGVADTDSDGDGTANCVDGCPNDPTRIVPGLCGCGVPISQNGTGDVNGDLALNAFDLAAFVNELVSPTSPSLAACAADMNHDGIVSELDIDLLASALMAP